MHLPTLLAETHPARPAAPHPLAQAAAAPGRLHDSAVEILSALLDAPERAGPLLRSLFRHDRTLGSHDRRLAKDVIVAVMRHQPLYALCLREAGWDGADAGAALWRCALVATQGLPAAALDDPLRQGLGALEQPQRRLARWLEEEGLSEDTQLSRAGALPLHVAASLRRRFGLEGCAQLLVACNSRAPISLRANARLCTPEALVRRLGELGISARKGPYAVDSVIAQGPANLLATPPFREGWFELQDEGSQLIAELVSPPRGGLVLDLCAGAGGKSLAIAARAPKGARVLGTDVRAHALQQGERRLKRAGVKDRVRFTTIQADGPLPIGPGEAARVLVDAPCSGSGTLRRSPALRWRMSTERLAELQALQGHLLQRAAPLVRPGGRLIYATCSLLAEENERVFERFLAEHPGWTAVPVKEVLGAARAADLDQGGALLTAPHVHDTDGFFAAIAQRER